AARTLDLSFRAAAVSSSYEGAKDPLLWKPRRSRFLVPTPALVTTPASASAALAGSPGLKTRARFTGLRNDNPSSSWQGNSGGRRGVWIAVLLVILAGLAGPESRAQTDNQNVPAPDQQQKAETAYAEAQSTLEKSPLSAYEGAMVHDVQFRGAKRSDQAELLNRIPVHSGHRFHRAQLKDSLQMLYTTGRFKNIQVEAETLPDKSINVFFVVDEAVFIGALHMYGAPRPPTANQLLTSTKLRLGEEFTDDDL